MYVCMCVCVCVCIYIYVCVCVCLCVCYACMHARVCEREMVYVIYVYILKSLNLIKDGMNVNKFMFCCAKN